MWGGADHHHDCPTCGRPWPQVSSSTYPTFERGVVAARSGNTIILRSPTYGTRGSYRVEHERSRRRLINAAHAAEQRAAFARSVAPIPPVVLRGQVREAPIARRTAGRAPLTASVRLARKRKARRPW